MGYRRSRVQISPPRHRIPDTEPHPARERNGRRALAAGFSAGNRPPDPLSSAIAFICCCRRVSWPDAVYFDKTVAPPVSTPPVAFRVSVHGAPVYPVRHRPAVVPHRTVAAGRKNPAGRAAAGSPPSHAIDLRTIDLRCAALLDEPRPSPGTPHQNPPTTNRGSARKSPLEIAGSWEC